MSSNQEEVTSFSLENNNNTLDHNRRDTCSNEIEHYEFISCPKSSNDGLEMMPMLAISEQHSNVFHEVENEYDIICNINSKHTYDDPTRAGVHRKPLMISSSGGGGHIAAIKAMLSLFDNECLTMHTPCSYSKKPTSMTSLSIFGASRLTDLSFVKGSIEFLNLVVLPPKAKLLKAIEQLQSSEPRPYLDVLLDIYEAGDESAALWNINQREDNKQQLALLIALQPGSDGYNYWTTYHYYCKLLEQSYHEGKPYTEIISVQAMGLPALCDAVKTYNDNILYRPNIVIHQYMTDLPTKGAVHFFNVLSSLTTTQQQHMKLYAVGMNQTILNYFFKKGHDFLGVYDINPENNPMIRPGFFDSAYDNSDKFEIQMTLNYKINATPAQLIIHENEHVASIMLGSQAGTDTVKYVSTFLEHGVDRLFIFGGSNIEIKTKIHQLLQSKPEFADKIILLDNQDAPAIASIMTRSNMLVIRAGGLSVMEQMAMKHHKQQIIMIHHADPEHDTVESEMTSGVSWEDGNADILINVLQKQDVTVKKICPSKMADYLKQLGNYSPIVNRL